MYFITGGPSQFELMVSQYHGAYQSRHAVKFKLRPEGPKVTELMKILNLDKFFFINGSDREDGSGTKWLIRGITAAEGNKAMKGFYDTEARQGWLEVS